MTLHVYVAESKGFNFTVELEDKRVQVRFVERQFKTENDELADGIDTLIRTNAGIARRCKKTNEAEAEKMAIAHRKSMAGTGAVKGGVTAEAARQSMNTSLQERDLELRSQHADNQDFVDENLQLTESGTAAQTETPPNAIKLNLLRG